MEVIKHKTLAASKSAGDKGVFSAFVESFEVETTKQ
jgi:hypothetical protein